MTTSFENVVYSHLLHGHAHALIYARSIVIHIHLTRLGRAETVEMCLVAGLIGRWRLLWELSQSCDGWKGAGEVTTSADRTAV